MPFVVVADLQTSGRGRSGNQWVSLKGNLLTSIVIPLSNVPIRDVGQYSFLTAVALMDTFAGLGIEAQNKWPNDILVMGRKIAGILLESETDEIGGVKALIIGVGANISHAPEGAIFVNQLTGREAGVREFLDRFIANIQSGLLTMEQDGFMPIRERWLSKAYGIGTDIRIRLPKETFYGKFLGLDEQGALRVQVDGDKTERKIYSGEVFFG